MPKEFLRRYLPDADKIRANPALRPLGLLLHHTDIWRLNRRAVAGAAFIGLFCAFLPVPFQMLVAGALVVAFRCNLPIAIVLVWISNPLTIAPIFYFTYRLGAWLLDMRLEVESVELSFSWLFGNLTRIGYPLIFGSLLCGWIAGVSGFVVARLLWRLHIIQRWRQRRGRRVRGAVPQPDSAARRGAPESRPTAGTAARTGRQ